MHFTSAAIASLLSTFTVASALPEAMPAPNGGLHKRADFDPVAACRRYQPAANEISLVSTASHNVVFDPNDGLGSETGNQGAILMTANCERIVSAEYVARGGGNGFSALFQWVVTPEITYTIEAQVSTLGPIYGVSNARIWYDGVEKPMVFCSGSQSNIEGLDVDYFNVCNFVP